MPISFRVSSLSFKEGEPRCYSEAVTWFGGRFLSTCAAKVNKEEIVGMFMSLSTTLVT